ncbi:MAG: hypothetical protein IIC51_10870 [Planctomycetes bacterium]|nr:hypothetical protein [Planctomycetota bacterium]
MRVYAPFFPSRERERPVLNPALALGARISGAALRTVIDNCPWTIIAAGLAGH